MSFQPCKIWTSGTFNGRPRCTGLEVNHSSEVAMLEDSMV
jgi:hypothetical protein